MMTAPGERMLYAGGCHYMKFFAINFFYFIKK